MSTQAQAVGHSIRRRVFRHALARRMSGLTQNFSRSTKR